MQDAIIFFMNQFTLATIHVPTQRLGKATASEQLVPPTTHTTDINKSLTVFFIFCAV